MGESECESESLQIIIEVPPEIELSPEELAQLLEKFHSWIIDTKPEQKVLQTKLKQIRARVRTKGTHLRNK
jgi:hypothetical protein